MTLSAGPSTVCARTCTHGKHRAAALEMLPLIRGSRVSAYMLLTRCSQRGSTSHSNGRKPPTKWEWPVQKLDGPLTGCVLLAGLPTLNARPAQQLAVLLLRHALTALLDHRAHRERSFLRRRSRCPAQRPTGGAHRHERSSRVLAPRKTPSGGHVVLRGPSLSPRRSTRLADTRVRPFRAL